MNNYFFITEHCLGCPYYVEGAEKCYEDECGFDDVEIIIENDNGVDLTEYLADDDV